MNINQERAKAGLTEISEEAWRDLENSEPCRGLVITLQVEHQYFEASLAGEKLFEIRKISSKLLSCRYINLQSLKTQEIATYEVGYRLPLKECNRWWNHAFIGDSAEYMVIGLKPCDFTLQLKGEL